MERQPDSLVITLYLFILWHLHWGCDAGAVLGGPPQPHQLCRAAEEVKLTRKPLCFLAVQNVRFEQHKKSQQELQPEQ